MFLIAYTTTALEILALNRCLLVLEPSKAHSAQTGRGLLQKQLLSPCLNVSQIMQIFMCVVWQKENVGYEIEIGGIFHLQINLALLSLLMHAEKSPLKMQK